MRRIPMGTKSVLFGAHCWFIHPFFTAAGWTKLYGFPCDPRLWFAFFVHDLGYWGCAEMDNEEGENHVCFGADLCHRLFDTDGDYYWHDLLKFHSRFFAKRCQEPCSKLCYADKLAVALEPWWLYLPRVWASSELGYYMNLAKKRTDAGEPRTAKYSTMNLHTANPRQWFASMTAYLTAWVEEHKDGRNDTWTPGTVNV